MSVSACIFKNIAGMPRLDLSGRKSLRAILNRWQALASSKGRAEERWIDEQKQQVKTDLLFFYASSCNPKSQSEEIL